LDYTDNVCIEQPWDNLNDSPIPCASDGPLAYTPVWLCISITDWKVRLPVLWKHCDCFFVSRHTFVSVAQIIFGFCMCCFVSL